MTTEQKTQLTLGPYGGRHAEIMGFPRQVVVHAGIRWDVESQTEQEMSFWGHGTVKNKFRDDLPIDQEALSLANLLKAAPDLLEASLLAHAAMTVGVKWCNYCGHPDDAGAEPMLHTDTCFAPRIEAAIKKARQQ